MFARLLKRQVDVIRGLQQLCHTTQYHSLPYHVSKSPCGNLSMTLWSFRSGQRGHARYATRTCKDTFSCSSTTHCWQLRVCDHHLVKGQEQNSLSLRNETCATGHRTTSHCQHRTYEQWAAQGQPPGHVRRSKLNQDDSNAVPNVLRLSGSLGD
jgi:hypothetical protein